MDTLKKNHGGKRDGAGRKRMGEELKQNLTVRLAPAVIEKLESLASGAGVSKGVFLEELIKKA